MKHWRQPCMNPHTKTARGPKTLKLQLGTMVVPPTHHCPNFEDWVVKNKAHSLQCALLFEFGFCWLHYISEGFKCYLDLQFCVAIDCLSL